jgi:hypothetical protein
VRRQEESSFNDLGAKVLGDQVKVDGVGGLSQAGTVAGERGIATDVKSQDDARVDDANRQALRNSDFPE